MLGKMADKDFYDSLFAGVMAQVQCYILIYIYSADYVSATARNGLMDRPTTNNQMKGHQQGLFHGLPNELQISLVIFAMEDAPENRKSNNNDLNQQRSMQQIKDELTQGKVLEHSKDEFIEALI